jgi:hypothetical protein
MQMKEKTWIYSIVYGLDVNFNQVKLENYDAEHENNLLKLTNFYMYGRV